jgi:hypothetical protein
VATVLCKDYAPSGRYYCRTDRDLGDEPVDKWTAYASLACPLIHSPATILARPPAVSHMFVRARYRSSIASA